MAMERIEGQLFKNEMIIVDSKGRVWKHVEPNFPLREPIAKSLAQKGLLLRYKLKTGEEVDLEVGFMLIKWKNGSISFIYGTPSEPSPLVKEMIEEASFQVFEEMIEILEVMKEDFLVL